MKKLIFIAIIILTTPCLSFAADTKASALSAPGGGPERTDKVYIVDDPGGTPASTADTIANILSLVVDGDIPTTLTLETISGTPVITNGPRIGTDDTDHLIDEASNGAGSATLYIGNESILASGDIGVSVQGILTNEAGLYAALSDVSDFVQPSEVDVEMLSDVTGEGTAATYALFDDNDGTYSFRAIADGDIPDSHSHAADAIDAITEIASALKSGTDTILLTGTAGTNTYYAAWNADGDLVDGSGVPVVSGGALGTPSSGTLTNVSGLQTILTTDSGDAAATWYPIISDGATGEQAMQTDSGLAFNPSTNVLTVNGGVNVPANSTAAQYQDFYEDTDDGSNYFRITGQALTGDRTLTLPDFNAALLASGNVDATGDLADGSVDPVHLADGDYGPFTMSSGTFSMDANSIDSDQYVDSSIDPAHVASGVWDFGTSVEGDTLTEGGNAVYNATETPGGELGGTWASPTVDDTGITLTSITIGALLGVDSIDATGAVDMDYGSVDVTDHTFTTDGGTTIIDGSTITPAPADDPLIYFDPSTASESEWWIGINHDSVGDDNDSIEIRQSATPGTNVEFEIEPDADIIIGSGADADTTITIDNDDTDGVIQRMADEKTWEFNNLLADTPQTYDATDAADTDVTVGTELTSSIVIITGDNDTDNDEIDLQNGNVAGQILIFIAGSGIDADDTITIDTTTDSTCTGCVTTVLNATGDTRTLIWTGATWATISSTDAP